MSILSGAYVSFRPVSPEQAANLLTAIKARINRAENPDWSGTIGLNFVLQPEVMSNFCIGLKALIEHGHTQKALKLLGVATRQIAKLEQNIPGGEVRLPELALHSTETTEEDYIACHFPGWDHEDPEIRDYVRQSKGFPFGLHLEYYGSGKAVLDTLAPISRAFPMTTFEITCWDDEMGAIDQYCYQLKSGHFRRSRMIPFGPTQEQVRRLVLEACGWEEVK